MKKLVLLLVASLCLLLNPSFSEPQYHKIGITENYQTIVYITKTGSKYHLGDCSYLRQSKIKTTKKEAEANGYTACSRCKP
jgi:hypothetical protein